MIDQWLSINWESVNSLRCFAGAMQYGAEQILTDTKKFAMLYESLAPEFGQLATYFETLVNECRVSAAGAAVAVGDLPASMERTAQALEEYLIDSDIPCSSSADPCAAPRIGEKVLDKKIITKRS